MRRCKRRTGSWGIAPEGKEGGRGWGGGKGQVRWRSVRRGQLHWEVSMAEGNTCASVRVVVSLGSGVGEGEGMTGKELEGGNGEAEEMIERVILCITRASISVITIISSSSSDSDPCTGIALLATLPGREGHLCGSARLAAPMLREENTGEWSLHVMRDAAVDGVAMMWQGRGRAGRIHEELQRGVVL